MSVCVVMTACDVILCSSELDLDSEAPPTKKARVEDDDTDFSMASLATGVVKEVS